MKISLNWIKEFVDLNGISEEEIIKRQIDCSIPAKYLKALLKGSNNSD